MMILTTYRQLRHRQAIMMILLLLLTLGVLFLSLTWGTLSLHLSDLSDPQSSGFAVLYRIRLPRSLGAMVSGAILGTSGLIMQQILNNPMASPYTLGISGSSAFGAALAIVLPSLQFSFCTEISALVFASFCVFFIITLGRLQGMHSTGLILGGIMLNAFFGALTTTLQYFSSEQKIAEILFWTFGDLNRITGQGTLVLSIILILAFSWLHGQRWNLALLSTGDENALASGLNPRRFRTRMLLLASFLTALVVAQIGIIAFVGLVVPHITRLFIQDDGPWMWPACAVTGSLFLLLCTQIAQHAFSPLILPVGIVTAFFGAPFFLVLLGTSRRQHA